MWESVRFSLSYTYTHFEDGVVDSSGTRHIDENALMTRLAMYF